jgi:hypothetical protein
MRGRWYRSKDLWCPRHSWPPAWARLQYYPDPSYPYSIKPGEELQMLESSKNNLESELVDLTKSINELKKLIREKK